jgi:hypothetical protein
MLLLTHRFASRRVRVLTESHRTCPDRNGCVARCSQGATRAPRGASGAGRRSDRCGSRLSGGSRASCAGGTGPGSITTAPRDTTSVGRAGPVPLKEFIDGSRGIYCYEYTPRLNDVVLDVGAGVGNATLLFARLVGSNGRVIALEAHPTTFDWPRVYADSTTWHMSARFKRPRRTQL